MKKFLIIPMFLFLLNCAESKKPIQTDSTINQSESTKNIETAEGVVLEINQGKDGYTAKLKSSDGVIYFATISRANLKNTAQYKAVTIGEKLKVRGEFWKMESENHITVREIL